MAEGRWPTSGSGDGRGKEEETREACTELALGIGNEDAHLKFSRGWVDDRGNHLHSPVKTFIRKNRKIKFNRFSVSYLRYELCW